MLASLMTGDLRVIDKKTSSSPRVPCNTPYSMTWERDMGARVSPSESQAMQAQCSLSILYWYSNKVEPSKIFLQSKQEQRFDQGLSILWFVSTSYCVICMIAWVNAKAGLNKVALGV